MGILKHGRNKDLYNKNIINKREYTKMNEHLACQYQMYIQ